MIPIQEISDVMLVFPTDVSKLLPPWDDIPEDFKRERGDAKKWIALVNTWFFSGLKNLRLAPKDGVDQNKALRHVKACLGSFEPPHEHKTAGVAYLLSQWFDDATWEQP